MCTLTRFVETLKTKTIKHLVTVSNFIYDSLFPGSVCVSFFISTECHILLYTYHVVFYIFFRFIFARNMRTCAQMQLLPCFVSFIKATTCKLLNFLAHFLAQWNENPEHRNCIRIDVQIVSFRISLHNIVYNNNCWEIHLINDNNHQYFFTSHKCI